jgi:hypothetical protein
LSSTSSAFQAKRGICFPRFNTPSVRIETVPLILGVLIAMLGIGIMFDAWTPDTVVSHERRRRSRVERHRNGEAMLGLGVLALAAAFIGRDNWRYSILVVIIGALFLVVGTILNAHYVRDLFVNRGPLRRREESEQGTELVAAAPRAGDLERPVPGNAIERPVPSSVTNAPRPGWPATERRKSPREGDRSRQPPPGATDDPPAPNH